MVSREIGSRPLGVILTVRREVFICGETEVMVPWRIVPVVSQSRVGWILVWYLGSLVRSGRPLTEKGKDAPFFSSIVTVSLAHFIKNLPL
jgi:hypothetical protein